MSKTCRWLLVVIVAVRASIGPAMADFHSDEPQLYAGGFPSADSLRPREWVLAGPFGGWLGYGLSSRLSVVWDYPAAFSGILGTLARYQIPGRSASTRYALEGYLTYFSKTYTDQRIDDFQVDHRGGQGWVHLIRTQRITEESRITVYAGVNYKNYQLYRPYKKDNFPDDLYRHDWNPDAGVGWDWEAKPWMIVHLNALYGNSFLYEDLTAVKSMAVAALQFAPFSDRRIGVLRNLRFEFNLLATDVPPAHFSRLLPFSILPYVYWQWGGTADPNRDVLHHI